jgi:hypothetical protein
MPEKNFDKMLSVYGVKPIDLGEIKPEEKPSTPLFNRPASHPEAKPLKALDPRIKRNWEDIQKKYKYPVNAIGVKIDPKDKETLRIWRENGIDKFIKD